MKNPNQWPASSVEMIAVDRLVPYAKNSRTHNEAQIKQIVASIREFGFTNPILCDESGMIIAGHGRIMAAKRIGLTEVPVMTARGWSETQKKSYVIADNKLALNAGWDEVMLKDELGELNALGADMRLTGFTLEEISDLCDDTLDFSVGSDDARGDDRLYLAIGKRKVAITEGELKQLTECYDRYVQEHGMPFGFGAWLAEGRKPD